MIIAPLSIQLKRIVYSKNKYSVYHLLTLMSRGDILNNVSQKLLYGQKGIGIFQNIIFFAFHRRSLK